MKTSEKRGTSISTVKKVKPGEGIYTPSLTYEQVSLPSKIESKTSWMEIFEDCK